MIIRLSSVIVASSWLLTTKSFMSTSLYLPLVNFYTSNIFINFAVRYRLLVTILRCTGWSIRVLSLAVSV